RLLRLRALGLPRESIAASRSRVECRRGFRGRGFVQTPLLPRASRRLVAVLACFGILLSAAHAQAEHRYLEIVCRDAVTGALLSGVELTTRNGIVHVSDANGVIAFYEPGLMGRSVFFRIAKPGYTYAPSGFPTPGGLLPTVEGLRLDLRLL